MRNRNTSFLIKGQNMGRYRFIKQYSNKTMKKTLKPILLIIGVIIVIVSVWHISNKNLPNEVIKVGAILHLTGDQSEPAEAFLQGIQLAVDEINNAGGILNKKIKLIVEDDNLKPEKANSAAVKLINVDKINVGINASFLEAMANGPTFEQAKVPVITLWDSAKDIEDIGNYVFGIGIWTPSAGEVAAQFAYDLGLRKVVIVNIQNEWSQAVSSIFKQKFQKLGGTIIEEHPINPSNANDFRTVIAKILEKNPDGIYSPVTDGVTVFYKQLKELGFKETIITSDIITEHHIDILGPLTEGIFQTQALIPTGERTLHMEKEYVKKYNKEPKQTLFIAWGYDAVYMIKKAIEIGNSIDPTTIKDNLYNIKGLVGASGEINIDKNGSSQTLENMFQIKNGEFVRVE